jgi:hypothetical protein
MLLEGQLTDLHPDTLVRVTAGEYQALGLELRHHIGVDLVAVAVAGVDDALLVDRERQCALRDL